MEQKVITCKFAGGLGNNLFQLAAIYNLHKKFGVDFCLPTNVDRSNLKKHYSQSRMLEINHLFDNNFNFQNLKIVKNYHHLDLNVNYNSRFSPVSFYGKGTCYNGYFQSSLYHDSFNPQEDFILNSNIKKHLKEKYKKLFHKPTISIHFRIGGDRVQKKVQYYHKNLDISFYKKSIDLCLSALKLDFKDINLLLFSDELEIAKSYFIKNNLDVITVNNKNNIEDFICMSLCDHNIIGNSSFSWWSAYLNNNSEKMVFAPKSKWYGPAYQHFDLADLFPNDWVTL
jgi:hypothetical protein